MQLNLGELPTSSEDPSVKFKVWGGGVGGAQGWCKASVTSGMRCEEKQSGFRKCREVEEGEDAAGPFILPPSAAVESGKLMLRTGTVLHLHTHTHTHTHAFITADPCSGERAASRLLISTWED